MSGIAAMCVNAISVSASRPRDGSEKYACSEPSTRTRLCTNSFVRTASCQSRRCVMKRSSSAPVATAMTAIETKATTANQRLRLKRSGFGAAPDEGMGAVGPVSVLIISPRADFDASSPPWSSDARQRHATWTRCPCNVRMSARPVSRGDSHAPPRARMKYPGLTRMTYLTGRYRLCQRPGPRASDGKRSPQPSRGSWLPSAVPLRQ